MNTRAKLIIGIAIIAVAAYAVMALDIGRKPQVSDFATCAAAGNEIMESYPRQCRDDDGNLYVEEAPASDPSSMIVVTNPMIDALISSPVTVSGEARGMWYFEASFPVQILDANGVMLGQTPATAQGEWMTTEFVPFEASIAFSSSTTATGTIRFMRDNPSGLPENEAHIDIPIRFAPVR